jgi:hypothetical protein
MELQAMSLHLFILLQADMILEKQPSVLEMTKRES